MTHHLVGAAEIAEMLGVSRQRVDQLVSTYEDFPSPEAELSGGRVWSRTAVETWKAMHSERRAWKETRGERPRRFERRSRSGLFQRFTDRARAVVVLAQQEARNLQHDYIGTEHLLLGLLREERGLAAQALQSCGVSLELVRTRVREIIGEGSKAPQGHIPFTPRTKKVLELALREALGLQHDYIGTEHILLGLIAESEGVAAKVIEEQLALNELRDALLETMYGFRAADEGSDPGPLTPARLAERLERLEARLEQLENRLAEGA